MAEEAKHLETGRADRSVWLMKCPTIVSQAWQEAAAAAASSVSGGPNPNPNPVVAKVILSFDPLSPDEEPKQASCPPLGSCCVVWLDPNAASLRNNLD
jgi:transcription initiation factor TFIIF subunit beta